MYAPDPSDYCPGCGARFCACRPEPDEGEGDRAHAAWVAAERAYDDLLSLQYASDGYLFGPAGFVVAEAEARRAMERAREGVGATLADVYPIKHTAEKAPPESEWDLPMGEATVAPAVERSVGAPAGGGFPGEGRGAPAPAVRRTPGRVRAAAAGALGALLPQT